MNKGNALIMVIVLVILIAGGFLFLNKNNDSVMEEESMENKSMEDESMMEDKEGIEIETELDLMNNNNEMMMESSYNGDVLAGEITPLIDFNTEDYNKALKEKKIILLYFYANWCPTCKEETAKALYPAFDELQEGEVIGFRVNYNDNETTQDEKDLAREFGVAYQHTKVFLKNGERVLKSPESWSKDRYLKEINNILK